MPKIYSPLKNFTLFEQLPVEQKTQIIEYALSHINYASLTKSEYDKKILPFFTNKDQISMQVYQITQGILKKRILQTAQKMHCLSVFKPEEKIKNSDFEELAKKLSIHAIPFICTHKISMGVFLKYPDYTQ